MIIMEILTGFCANVNYISCAIFYNESYEDRIDLIWISSARDPEKIVRVNKKVWSQRLSSSFPLELTSSAFDHPPSFFLLSRIARPTIDRFSRIIDSTLRREELGQSSSTAHHNFRLTRSLFILSISSSEKLSPFCKLLFNRRCFFFFFFPLLLLLFFFVAVVVVVALFYFSSYSHAQFCVLLPPVTLAENNNKICSLPLVHGRRWFIPLTLLFLGF